MDGGIKFIITCNILYNYIKLGELLNGYRFSVIDSYLCFNTFLECHSCAYTYAGLDYDLLEPLG